MEIGNEIVQFGYARLELGVHPELLKASSASFFVFESLKQEVQFVGRLDDLRLEAGPRLVLIPQGQIFFSFQSCLAQDF